MISPISIVPSFPWEHYHKWTTDGGCPGLSDDPEKSSQNKTLRTTKLHNLGHGSWWFTGMKVDTLSSWRTRSTFGNPNYGDNNQQHTQNTTSTLWGWPEKKKIPAPCHSRTSWRDLTFYHHRDLQLIFTVPAITRLLFVKRQGATF